MASIQSLGVGSGLDVNSIVTQLLALEQQPLNRLKQAESGVQARISAYGNIRSKIDALETAASGLASADTWSQSTVDLAGAQGLTIKTSGAAATGPLDIEVVELARKQSTAFRIPTGAPSVYNGPDATFSFGAYNFTVSTGDSLQDIVDDVNSLDPETTGVRASLMTDANGTVLALSSVDSGVDAGFTVTLTEPELSSFLGTRTDSAARNLHVKVDGVSLYSATNTLSNVVEGLTITASQVSAGPQTVTITRDTASVKSKIEGFVKAYNDLISLLRQQTSYNPATKTAALLQGDRVAVGLQSQVRTALIESSAASSVFDRLSDLGIDLTRDGQMQIQATKLETALEDLDETALLFSRDDANAANDGVAVRLGDLVNDLTSASGTLATKQSALQAELARNQQEQDRANDRLARVEARLKSQYSALDTKMASLSGLGQYVSQQIQQYNKS